MSGPSGARPPLIDRFPLLMSTRRVLPVALVFASGAALFAPGAILRAGCVAFAAFAAAVWAWQASARPELVVDDDGYAVVERGREKLRVPWRDVRRVRADRAEHALYVDTGDPARNLLVPPKRGYGFRFARQELLYARVIERVPEAIVEMVARLDEKKAPAP